MRKRNAFLCAVLAGLVGTWVSMNVVADDAKTPAAKPSAEEMQAMMEKMGAPAAEHAKLAKYAGNFTADVQMWMDPAAPPTQSTGKATNEMILGGRHLKQTFEGDMMGKPFHGIGFSGYDTLKKQWYSTWMDDMSTGFMFMESGVDTDAAGKTIKLSGEMMCPMTGKVEKFRDVTTFIDDDTYKFEMWGPGMDGKEHKSMEIVYKRVK